MTPTGAEKVFDGLLAAAGEVEIVLPESWSGRI